MKILNYDVKDKQSDYNRKSHLCLTGVLGCLYAVLQVQAKLTFFWIGSIDSCILIRYISMLKSATEQVSAFNIILLLKQAIVK